MPFVPHGRPAFAPVARSVRFSPPMKLVEGELGQHHVAADIGCHLFSILPPFNIGATTMGYGLGPASPPPSTSSRTSDHLGHGRWWLLAQWPVHQHRERGLQQAGRRDPHRRQLSIRRRPAARTFSHPARTTPNRTTNNTSLMR